mmetsp:Transcript_4593/g.8712  ORF Transcript_4593/g.8712 Transcript_4593/m.8712 type:complete len:760 (-) Transcript_4593:718-2997(-)
MSVSTIDINLDRSDPVYYAGEVVRGTVALETTGSLNCRGFHIHLQARARVLWFGEGTAQGNNRREGSTLFQSQRHTLVGNYYKTVLLDEAGVDADFDVVPNSGILRIPCDFEEHDDKKFKLIVRVMDYDWKLGDDLLGEILLKVSPLVEAPNKTTFKLSRQGRPEQGQITLSAKWLPFESVFPMASRSGERVSSEAIKPVCLELTIHNATGLRRTCTLGQNNVYCQVYRIPKETAIKRGKGLPDPSTKMTIVKGRSVYPFAFALRTDAPGSAELPVLGSARLRYDLYAHIDRAFSNDPSRKLVVTVIPNRPVPLVKLLGPVFHIQRDQPILKRQMCGCRTGQIKGLVSIHLSLNRRSFAPGELIDLIASSVEYPPSQTLSVTVFLVLHVEMSTSTGQQTTKRHYTTLWSSPLPPNSQRSLSQLGLTSEMIRMPPVFPCFDGGVPAPSSRHFACLRWSYTIDLVVAPTKESALVGDGVASSSIPILVAAAPPHEHILHQLAQSGAPPPEELQSPAMQTPFSIFADAISNNDPSDTTPWIMGPECGGSLLPATGFSETAFTFDEEEDAGAIGGETPVYVPLIHTSAATGRSTPPKQPLQPTQVPPSTSTAAAASLEEEFLNAETTTPESGGTVEALLHALSNNSNDISKDKRRIIGAWMLRHYHSPSSSLSPTDVGSVLSTVTSVLEQPSVTVTLLEGGLAEHLTCAHICAAVQACPYQKAPVAKLMARLARDPEQQHTVLALMDTSFERRAVEQAFRSHS